MMAERFVEKRIPFPIRYVTVPANGYIHSFHYSLTRGVTARRYVSRLLLLCFAVRQSVVGNFGFSLGVCSSSRGGLRKEVTHR